ncbi:MAG TPA: ATP-binding protein [Candidatus Thermoplasmatota archaeon]|nr:ATP-binding protein [Candidatus Thermoplasmatota archaeon]
MTAHASGASPFARARALLPQGQTLPLTNWQRRHRGVLLLLAAHAVFLPVFGIRMGHDLVHSVFEGGIVAGLTLLAWSGILPRRWRGLVASAGLITSSAILVHLSGGYLEAHFHFFVMLGVIFLYEDWLPFGASIAYVAIHHGLMGSLDPGSVYNHPDAIAHPWTWASIHATFILGLSVALIIVWNITERARVSETAALREAHGLRRQVGAQEKMAALGSLASGLAHEVRTPLTIAGTSASVIRMRVQKEYGADPVLTQAADDLHLSIDRMNRLIVQMRHFAKGREDERVQASLHTAVKEAVDLYTTANRSVRNVVVQLEATPVVSYSPMAVQQIVLNLVSNAADAIDPAKGTIRVRTETREGQAALVVQDDGEGIPLDVVPHMYEPLFTTKTHGTGLGLSIVRRMVEQHGATIDCKTSRAHGTSFTVTFPPAAQTPATPTAA